MKIEILGAGGATEQMSTAYLLNEDTLIDCGIGVVHKIIQTNQIEKIKNVYISHIHMDHIGGFELLVYYWDFMKSENINVYAGKEFWDLFEKMACSKIEKPFTKNGIKNAFPVEHMHLEAYGFIFQENQKTIIISGDTDKVIEDIDLENTLLFHDMGATGINFPNHVYKAHVTEEDIFKKYGKNSNIIGIHTNQKLNFYQKAKEGEIFEI